VASDRDRVPADDETGVVGVDEVTQADTDWPVADLYRVEPGADAEAPSGDAVVVAQQPAPSPARRLPPVAGPAILIAIALVVAALILAGLLLGDRGDDESSGSTASPTQSLPTGTTPTTPGAPAAATKSIALPDVRGKTLADARKTLEKASLRVRVIREESDRPAGVVLKQAPPPGTKLRKGDVVTLTVSGTSTEGTRARVDVPGVVGLSASDAVVAIREAGLVARIRLVRSSEPVGTVLSQSPVDGTKAAKGATVRLDVARVAPSPAPTVARIEVPDLVGSTSAAARRRLQSLGLTADVVSVDSTQPAGTVVDQSPRAGTQVRKGASVTVRVSRGPAKVAVPDVTGLDEAEARLRLENAGFEVNVVDQETADPAEDGVVLAQEPAGGMAAEGSVVTLTVGRLT
jgi:beta-lactam-binding protein with PASTA domain